MNAVEKIIKKPFTQEKEPMPGKQKASITQEEMRLALLEQKNDTFHETLGRIDNRIQIMESILFDLRNDFKKDMKEQHAGIKNEIHDLRQEGRVQFKWNMGFLLGLYATAISSAVGVIMKLT